MKSSTTLTVAHNQWASRPADQRFQTLESLRESVTARRARAKSFNRSVNDLEVVVEGGELILNHNISPTAPTHWAFSQLCGAARTPASYLRTLSPELAAANLNYSIKRAPKEDYKLMTLVDPAGGTNTLQAVTSSTYGRIWDADVVESVSRIVERSGGKFYNPKAYEGGKFGAPPVPSGLYASDHDVFMFMIDGGSLLDAGPRAQLNRGFIVWNSETGSKTLGIMAFLFNQCCGNHFIYGAQDIQTILIKHTSGAPSRFDREVMPLLTQYCEASAKPVEDRVRAAQQMMLSKLIEVPGEKVLSDAWAGAFAKKFDFTRGEVKEAVFYAQREESQCASLWDIIQGFTAAAREYEHVDSRLNLEKRAGRIFETVFA